MFRIRIAGGSLLILACTAASAAPSLEQLRAWDARMQRQQFDAAPTSASPAARSEDDVSGALPQDLSQLAATDAPLADKWYAVSLHARAMRDGALTPPPAWQAASSRAMRIVLGDAHSPGRTCEHALSLRAGEALRIVADAALGSTGLWVEVRSDDGRPVLVSTRGSSVDARLAAYADCREQGKPALAQADDSIGLQAELALSPHHAGQFWRVHVRYEGVGELLLVPAVGETISGRVTRESNGDPIAGVRVAAFGASGGYEGSTLTEVDGRYTLASLNGAGTHFVRSGISYSDAPIEVLHEAYGGARCASPEAYYLATCTDGTLAPIAVASGQAVNNIDLTLGSGAVVEGTLRDAQTQVPISGASVALYDNGGIQLRLVYVDLAGRYRIGGLLAGQVRVAARSATHRGEVYPNIPCTPAESCPVLAGQAISALLGSVARADFALDPWAHVEATVSFAPSIGGSGEVVLTSPEGTPLAYGYVYSDSSNTSVRLGPLEPGSYRVAFRGGQGYFGRVYSGIDCVNDCNGQFASGTPVTIDSFGQRVVLTIAPRPWPQVLGSVTDAMSGATVAGAIVALYATGSVTRQTTSGSDGRFAIGLPPGNHLLHAASIAHANQAYPGVACENPAVPPYCAGASMLGSAPGTADRTIDFVLGRNGQASGTVTSPGGAYIYNSNVRPLNAAAQPNADVTVQYFGNDGAFRILDIPAGNHYFGAVGSFAFAQVYPGIDCAPSQSYLNEWASCTLGAAQLFPVSATSPVNGLVFNLRTVGSRLGRVVRADSLAPIPGVAIDLWTLAGEHVGVVISDAQGRFAIAAPTYNSGSYAVSTDTPWPYVNQVHNGIACPNGSVYARLCTLAGATAVPLPTTGTSDPLIEFRLALQPGAPFFVNGFE